MGRKTKMIAVHVGASCTGSGFSSQKPSLVPLLLLSAKVTYGEPYYNLLPGRVYSA